MEVIMFKIHVPYELNGIIVKYDSINCFSFGKYDEGMCTDSYDPHTATLIKRLSKIELTGNENWKYDENKKSYYYNQEGKFYQDLPIGGFYDAMLCTHFSWREGDINPEYGQFVGGVTNEIMFCYDYGKDGLENFKNWLKNRYEKKEPVQVIYILNHTIIKVTNIQPLHKYYTDSSDPQMISDPPGLGFVEGMRSIQTK
jgi:hypothetical protein